MSNNSLYKSKYSWADAPLKWHEFYSFFIWIQLGISVLSYINAAITVYNYSLPRDTATFALLSISEIVVNLAVIIEMLVVAVNLSRFRKQAYSALWAMWITQILNKIFVLIVIFAFGLGNGVASQSGILFGSLIWAIPNLIYYRNRKLLFYTEKEKALASAGDHDDNISNSDDIISDPIDEVQIPNMKKGTVPDTKTEELQIGFCRKCGNKIDPESLYCNKCGKRIRK